MTVPAIVAALTSSYLLRGYPYGPMFLPLVLTLYTVARQSRCGGRCRRRRRYCRCCSRTCRASRRPARVGRRAPRFGLGRDPVHGGNGAAHRRVVEARSRAEMLRTGASRRAAAAGQEVHDVVGHGLAAIQMQADITLHVLDRGPTSTRAGAGGDQPGQRGGARRAAHHPAVVRRAEDDPDATPGLARVDELCRGSRHAGVTVDLEVVGRRPPDAAARGRPGRIPDPPGGADQRGQALRAPSARVAVRYRTAASS